MRNIEGGYLFILPFQVLLEYTNAQDQRLVEVCSIILYLRRHIRVHCNQFYFSLICFMYFVLSQ